MPFNSLFRGSKMKHKSMEEECERHLDDGKLSSSSLSSLYRLGQESPWANLPVELLLDIIGRVEGSETSWPSRRTVVSCGAVCKSWREITKEVIRTPEECGLFTFPMSLKQPGTRDSPIQCFIRRERGTSTYKLYLGLSPAISGDASKLLLAAKRIRKATKTYFILSYAANDFSQTSDNYAGQLRSNFFGSKFFIHDCQPPPSNAAVQPHGWPRKRISVKKVSPRPPNCNYNVASIGYELNVLRTRGPRRMHCIMHTIPVSAVQEGGTAPTPSTFNYGRLENLERQEKSASSSDICEAAAAPLILKNKTPRWHEQLQCWCLNFRGRVTVASVKNFQLAAVEPASEQDKVLLQFGKIGKDIFTMDYMYPLSAFQAFAICLSSFDTKPACE